MTLRLVPMTLNGARKHVRTHHAHHDPPRRIMHAVGVESDGRIVCVAVTESPKGRGLLDGRTIEVTRVASDGTTEHAASKAIAALARACIALGWTRLVSYTLLGEAGTSYRAAGWWPTALVKGREWSCKSRPRERAAQPGDKVRWEFGPSAPPRDESVDALVREMVGRVDLPRRVEREPLLALIRKTAWDARDAEGGETESK